MKLKPLLVLAPFLLLCGCLRAPEDNGLAPLEGEWNVIELNEHGKEYDKAGINAMNVRFKNGDYHRVQYAPTIGEAKVNAYKPENMPSIIRVDVTKYPQEIDFVLIQEEFTGRTLYGILAFEGDRLKICVAKLDKPRPTDFVPDKNHTIMLLERRPPPPPPPPQTDPQP